MIALKRHVNNPGVQEAGCAALRHLAYNNGNLWEESSWDWSAMKDFLYTFNYTHCYHQQYSFCSFEMQLIYHSLDNNKASISRAGGIEAVINALRRHVDHAVVQEAACAALYNLSFNSKLSHVTTSLELKFHNSKNYDGASNT